MAYRRRVFFTDKQKSEIGTPLSDAEHRLPGSGWQRGESMSLIGRVFDRGSLSIYPLLARTGGIRPADRIRSRLALTLTDRVEISRALRAQMSLRPIARSLKRSASTISREVRPTEGSKTIVPRHQMSQPGIALTARSCASWQAMPICVA